MFRLILFVMFLIANKQSYTQSCLYPIHINNMWGLMDSKGNLVSDAEFNSIGEFESEGIALAQKDDLIGVIDSNGQLIIPCKYHSMDYIGQGLFSIKEDGVWKVINRKDEVVLDSMVGKINFLQNGYMTYEEISGIGLAHINRGILLPPEYYKFKFLTDQYIVAINHDFQKFLYDSTGTKILPNAFDKIQFTNSWIWTQSNGKWGAYDIKGQLVIPPIYSDYKPLGSNFYHFLNEKGRHFLYSLVSGCIINSKMKSYTLFNNNYVQFYNFNNYCGLIDVKGNVIVKDKYNAISVFGDNAFCVTLDNKQGVTDTNGNVIIPIMYDHIYDLDSKVAIVNKGKKFGIVNYKGKLVLPVIYTNTLSLNNNIARHKKSDNGLELFVFDENGELKDNSNFTNVKSIRINNSQRNFSSNRITNNITNRNDLRLSDSLIWKYHPGSRTWGLYNSEKNQYKFPPKYSSITVLKDLGLTLVCNAKYEIAGTIKTGEVDLKINRVYGLFNNKHGLPISKMEFIDIRFSDFEILGLDIARCIFVGGSHGILSKNGRILSRGYTYIGEFIEGKARVTRKGKLIVDLDKKIKRPLSTAINYFSSFRSGFSYDTNVYGKKRDLFISDGRLYCKGAQWGFLDTLGDLSSSYSFDYVTDYSNNRSMVKLNGNWGMLDEEGNLIIEPQYDDFNFLPKSNRQLFFISKNMNLYGAIDTNSNIIVPVKYTSIKEYHNDRIAVRDVYRNWGFVNRNAEEIIPTKYRLVQDFSENLAVVFLKNKWGAIDKDGNIVIEPKYSRMGDFKQGRAWVHLRNGYKGYINKKGELLFTGKYTKLTNYKDSIARVYIRNKGWGLIDFDGNYIMKPKRNFKKIEPFNEHGLAKVKIGIRYRLINKEGEFVGKRSYGVIRDFIEGYAMVRVQSINGFHLGKINLNYTFIDTTGELVTNKDFRQLQNFSEGRAVFTGSRSKRGYINYKGDIVVEPQYFMAEDFKNNRAVVWKSYNKTGVIDTIGDCILPVKYNKIIDIKEGLALVRKNSWTYYFVFEDSKRQTPINYQGAYAFENNLAPVKSGSKWGVINSKGLKTLMPKYSQIKPFKNGIAKVSVSKLLGVVDINGNIIIEPEYEYVSYVGDGLFRVEKGDEMGYLNMQGNWVWELH